MAFNLDSRPSLLGECVVYLGVFNYFFAVDESTPIVSKIGTEIGRLQLRITPYDEFVPYMRADVDNPEQQIHEFMDRFVQFRVQLSGLSQLIPLRFSHVSVRYTFFRETNTQTPRFRVDPEGDSVSLNLEFRHSVNVSDALVKYVTSSNLSIEVCAQSVGFRLSRY
ncbi:uncharacterized protein PITG_00044 [Phytophthora infestans T30-4]|uniref:Uncharacterized protein n=1 Tax=Phytophthora infestans (strain T30-4) TaxID=403677 RepID=D0MSQ9_PHYIT|nr:uncharacterized protein PITG_00044 [Phytophthora infestans T30-4]EEY57493.1 conserved hypothetical protein [Phytophthora infestans T30-4]|eukprot:XP_002908679.1 conserved hypothetical protein [Phytophthora infestans T30-4]